MCKTDSKKNIYSSLDLYLTTRILILNNFLFKFLLFHEVSVLEFILKLIYDENFFTETVLKEDERCLRKEKKIIQ